MPKKIELDDVDISRLYSVERIPATEIARTLGVSNKIIYKSLERSGTPRRDRRAVCEISKPIDAGELVRLYLAGSTIPELMHKFGYSQILITNRLENQGVKLRTMGETRSIRPPTEAELHHLVEARKKNLDGWNHTDEAKAKISRAKRANVDDLEIIRQINEEHLSEHEIAAKLGIDAASVCRHAKSTGLPYTPAPRSGERNPNWKNGKSFEPYCRKFNDGLKESIRSKFNHQCYLCPKTEAENGEKLCIHHIDYNKNSICDGREWPLLPLCRKCHSSTNFNRHYYFNLLMNYWAEKYIENGINV